MSDSAKAPKLAAVPDTKPLSRADILGAQDIPIRSVPIPQWKGNVWIRGLTANERDQWERSIVKMKGDRKIWNLTDVRARAAIRCVVDPPPGFDPDTSDADPTTFPFMFGEGDIPALKRKSAAALDTIWRVMQDLSGISEEDFEELTENLEQDHSGS